MHRLYILGDLLCSSKIATVVDSEKDPCDVLLGEQLNRLLFENNDFHIVNLEGPITDSTCPTRKGGSPNIKSEKSIYKLLNGFKNTVISGANNHITDYGEMGIKDTIEILRNNQIKTIGFGMSFEELNSHCDLIINNKRIRLYAVAQNEFSTTESLKRGVGANPYNPLLTFDFIRRLKENCDFLVVLFHSGLENFQYPTPNQVNICHKMVDCGADTVICQHSHCVGCEERYNGGSIVYGTGNFLFDISKNALWNTAIIPFFDFSSDVITLGYLCSVRTNKGIRLADNKERDSILKGFYERSSQLLDADKYELIWKKHCSSLRYTLLWNGFIRLPKIFYFLDRLFFRFLSKLILNDWEKNLTLYNYLRCESINEMCQTFFFDSAIDGKAHNR